MRILLNECTLSLSYMFFDTQVSKTYTKAEISLHNKKTDCWIIIKDKVVLYFPKLVIHSQL